MKTSKRILYVVLILSLLQGACIVSCTAHYSLYPKEGSVDRQLQYQVAAKLQQALSEEVLVLLCFSGGGMRAASMSYGVLEALQAIELPNRPTMQAQGQTASKKTLLDEVKAIMSVSGAVLRRPITASTERTSSRASGKNFFFGTSRGTSSGGL